MTVKKDLPDEYKKWLSEVDQLCRGKFGLRLNDLQDFLTRDAFDSGVSPKDFFDEEVIPAMREEYGSLVDDL